MEDDELFIHFFIISLLQSRKEEIFSVDYSQIPSILSQLYLRDAEEVENVFNYAKTIRQNTPYSIRLMVRRLEIFKPNSVRLKDLFYFYEPENMTSFPILPSEIFNIAYNNIISCPDSQCSNFKNLYDNDKGFYCDLDESGIIQSNNVFSCFNCQNRKKDNTTYILLDLRINDNKYGSDIKPGFLPMTVILDQDELMSDSVFIILYS
jgi:hypothetical protein